MVLADQGILHKLGVQDRYGVVKNCRYAPAVIVGKRLGCREDRRSDCLESRQWLEAMSAFDAVAQVEGLMHQVTCVQLS